MYISAEDLYAEWGRTNVDIWADVDGTGDVSTIAARINAAILDACGEIDDRLRGGPYTVSLSPVDTTVKVIARGLALERLRAGRSLLDDKDKTQPYVKRAKTILVDVICGAIRLTATRPSMRTTFAPTIIGDRGG